MHSMVEGGLGTSHHQARATVKDETSLFCKQIILCIANNSKNMISNKKKHYPRQKSKYILSEFFIILECFHRSR